MQKWSMWLSWMIARASFRRCNNLFPILHPPVLLFLPDPERNFWKGWKHCRCQNSLRSSSWMSICPGWVASKLSGMALPFIQVSNFWCLRCLMMMIRFLKPYAPEQADTCSKMKGPRSPSPTSKALCQMEASRWAPVSREKLLTYWPLVTNQSLARN